MTTQGQGHSLVANTYEISEDEYQLKKVASEQIHMCNGQSWTYPSGEWFRQSIGTQEKG